jgi:Zn-dependent membrane protease YugP
MFFDPTWIVLMIVSAGIGLITQGYITSTFRKWSRVPLDSGMSGAEVARRILDSNGLGDVPITQVSGQLSDHYDPRNRTLGLSSAVFSQPTVASAGVAAHEAGHAIQHAERYAFGGIRTALVPIANFGSQAALPLIILGLWIGATGLFWLGIVAYGGAVLFQLITLPVEFDASRRALDRLTVSGTMGPQQVAGARQVLTAAALTYVGAALISILQLLYFVGLGRRD